MHIEENEGIEIPRQNSSTNSDIQCASRMPVNPENNPGTPMLFVLIKMRKGLQKVQKEKELEDVTEMKRRYPLIYATTCYRSSSQLYRFSAI